MKNLDLRLFIDQTKVSYREIAAYMGIRADYLSRLMGRKLSQENEKRIIAAVIALSDAKESQGATMKCVEASKGIVFIPCVTESLEIVLKKRELVQCKDCRYWQDNNGGYPHPECRWGHEETPDANDYCSYGERR